MHGISDMPIDFISYNGIGTILQPLMNRKMLTLYSDKKVSSR